MLFLSVRSEQHINMIKINWSSVKINVENIIMLLLFVASDILLTIKPLENWTEPCLFSGYPSIILYLCCCHLSFLFILSLFVSCCCSVAIIITQVVKNWVSILDSQHFSLNFCHYLPNFCYVPNPRWQNMRRFVGSTESNPNNSTQGDKFNIDDSQIWVHLA